MVIAINTTTFSSDNETDNFLYETFSRITKQHPEHNFIFILDEAMEPAFIFPSNTIFIINPKYTNPLQYWLGSNQKLSSLLKKHKTDVLLTNKYFPSGIKVPVCLLASFNDKKNQKKAIEKAKAIVTNSEFLKQDISDNYKIDKEKIDVVYPGVDEELHSIDFLEREDIKQQYAAGNEFFLLKEVDAEKDLVSVLKAFSSFKKWQKSGMQILIEDNPKKNFEEQLKFYKYRSEVKLLKNISLTELRKITASSYALIYLSLSNKFPEQVLEAMKCNVPVITSNTSLMHETCSGTALYVNPDDHKDIADKMMLIFKDEILRKNLSEKGNAQVQKFGWDKTADSLWKSIEKACS